MEEFDDGPILGSNFSFWFILRGSIYASEDASQLSAIKKEAVMVTRGWSGVSNQDQLG